MVINVIWSFVKVLYSKLPTNVKQLPTFSHKVLGLNSGPPRWMTSVLPLIHIGPLFVCLRIMNFTSNYGDKNSSTFFFHSLNKTCDKYVKKQLKVIWLSDLVKTSFD